LVGSLLNLNNNTVPEASVRQSLKQASQDDDKSVSCRNWLKEKAPKYAKKIKALRKNVLMQQDKIAKCLESREKCFALLMSKVQTWTVKRRQLPQGTEESLLA